MAATAWMLRQDGKAFDVKVHIYCMGDSNLESEAEASSFLIATASKDLELASEILDTWMAFLIENEVSFDASEADIDDAIAHEVSSLPYEFAYPLSVSKLLDIHHSCNNYDDVDSLYMYCDLQRNKLDKLQNSIKDSLNQQFSRVRCNGRLNSSGEFAGPHGSIWCRVSSIGYDWSNTFYMFIVENYRRMKISSVFICRDYESDNGHDCSKPDYFYKATDDQLYYDMSIDEYLKEDNKHSFVFTNSKSNIESGVVDSIRHRLLAGETILEVCKDLNDEELTYDVHQLLSFDLDQCIDVSKFLDDANTRTKMKISKITHMIQRQYSFMTDIIVTAVVPRDNCVGNPVGFEMSFKIKSEISQINGLEISVISSKALSQTSAETVVRYFNQEYQDYCKYSNIKF